MAEEDTTGKQPDTDATHPDKEMEKTAVSPPEDATPTDTDETPTATYISGTAQGDEPQTLAQLFMTMPKAAKVAILIIVALILAAIIFWILSPKSTQPVEDIPGTETAVAAAITASAQPTSTITPTATPVMYIESETSVAQSAPVGSPTPIIYTIQTGDTLNKVARTYGVTVQDIVLLNNIYNPNSIPVGEELLIPTPGLGTSIPVNETIVATTSPDAQTTSAPQQVDATEPTQSIIPSGATAELVIRGSEDVALRIAAGPDYQAITTLPQGTFATIVAKTPDGEWYLIQLEDGFTRGWVLAEQTALLSPAVPDTIPTTPMP